MTETLAGGVTRLHNIKSAGDRLGIGRSKVSALIRSGELRSVQIGARRLVPEQAIVDFINELDAEAWGEANTMQRTDTPAHKQCGKQRD